MVKAICIVGLPGSGKTYLAEQLREEDPNLVIHDDMMDRGHLYTALCTLQGRNCILIDTNFCSSTTREVAEQLLKERGVEVEWIFFENNPEKCRRNIQYRRRQGDLRNVEGTIKRFEKIYRVPDGIMPREIWNDNHS